MGKARTRSSPLNLTLDAGALIALERGDGKMIALLDRAQKQNVRFHVPAGVVGQAWRDGSRQATLARFLRTDAVTSSLSMACWRELAGSSAAPLGRAM